MGCSSLHDVLLLLTTGSFLGNFFPGTNEVMLWSLRFAVEKQKKWQAEGMS